MNRAPMRRERCPRCRRAVPVTPLLVLRAHPTVPGARTVCPGSRTVLPASELDPARPLSYWTGPNLWVDSGNL